MTHFLVFLRQELLRNITKLTAGLTLLEFTNVQGSSPTHFMPKDEENAVLMMNEILRRISAFIFISVFLLHGSFCYMVASQSQRLQYSQVNFPLQIRNMKILLNTDRQMIKRFFAVYDYHN